MPVSCSLSNFRPVKIKAHRSMVILFLVYGCDNWSLVSKGEHRLRMFGNRVLREISGFGPNSVELTGERIKPHNVEFHDLYSPPDIVRVIRWRRMRWPGHVARMGDDTHTGFRWRNQE